jgi:hypothetical protein
MALRPGTVGEAARVSGVTPAAISLLLVFIKRWNQREPGAVHGSTSSPPADDAGQRAA